MLAKLERSLDSRAAKQRAVEEDRRQLASFNDNKPSSAAGLALPNLAASRLAASGAFAGLVSARMAKVIGPAW